MEWRHIGSYPADEDIFLYAVLAIGDDGGHQHKDGGVGKEVMAALLHAWVEMMEIVRMLERL